MKKLFALIFSVLLFSSFSNAYFENADPQDLTFAEEAQETIIINKATLENLQKRFAELQDLINNSTNVNLNVANPKPIYFTNVPLPPRPQSNLEQATYYSKALLKQIESIFKFTLDKADKLTSKKSIIAFFVLAGPFIALYCTYFDINPLRELIGSLFYHSSKATTKVGMEALEETGKGILKAATENPVTTAEVVVGAGAVYTGWEIFARASKEIADKAAPHIARTAAWCIGLIPLAANNARNRIGV